MAVMKKKIYYHDTDAGGVVYYANYLKYFEEARTEFLNDLGINLKALTDNNTWFVVKHVDIEYKSPARYADSLIIESDISKLKSVSLIFSQTIKRDDQVLIFAQTQMVCVDSSFRPKPIPEELHSLFKK
tara:strand:- start:9316 stop:9702 length:387 start_codon:yes stop_codon:yes gene_type:complete